MSELEFKRFLQIAIGSSDETISHLKMIEIILPGLQIDSRVLQDEYRTLSKRLNVLHSRWRSSV